MKTYSRVKAKQQLTDDVFTENAQETLKGNLSFGIFSDEEQQRSVDGRRKRGRNKSAVTGSGKQKNLKQGTLKKKSISEVKIQKSESVTSLSPPTDINDSDVLFGEGLPPVKKKRQSRAKKQEACAPKQKGRQKRNSASQIMTEKSQPSQPKKNMSKKGNENTSDEAKLLHNQLSSGSIIEAELPAGTQVRPEDKVSDWLAKSDECSHTSQDDTSKEVFRGAQSLTGDEMRCRLFPQEFFDNLNCVLERRPSAQAGQNVKARQEEFLSELALKTGNKQQSYLPKAAPTEKLYSVSDIDDQDLMIMCRSTQSGLQTGLHTKSGTSMTTSMGTSKSNGQTGTGTLMTTNTGSSKYTGTETGTQMETGTLMTSGTGTSKFTDTRTGTDIKTVTSSFPSETGTSRLTETRSDGSTGASSQFVSGASNADKINLSSKKKHYSYEVSDSLKLKDQRVQKYLCSTMRRSTSLNNADFPSELSAVTDSLRNQQREEKTPRKTEEDFKVPGSPTKSTAFKGIRKGILQPKNSTKLFTTGFVEIFDAIPQMSTIVCDNKSKVTVIENDDEQLSCAPKQKMQNIRSSTPNKGDTQGQAFQFEIDISSVNFDSGDEDLLHFHESREVNSEECIQLSTTLIDSQQDKVEINDTLKAVDDKGNSGKNLSPTIESIKESPKSNKQIDLKNPKNTATVKSKVINKRGGKTRKTLKSRELRNSVRKRSRSGLARVTSQSDFNRRRSSRISASNYMNKGSINNTNDKDVTIVKNSRNAISQDLRKVVESYEIVQPDTIVKDVYDIDNSDIVASNVITADKDASLNDDVFDIEESALNVPDAETQKMARKNYCTIITRRSKRTSSEIYFHPKGLLDFNTRSYSSVDSRSVNNLFIVERRESENKQICPKVSKSSKRDCITVCTLMDEDFTCPQKKISIVCYTATDTRSREEILATVPVDSLMS